MNSGAELGADMTEASSALFGEQDAKSFDDSIVRMFAAATLLWGLFAILVGLGVAHLLVIPKMFGGSEVYSFARLRPLHSSVALYAFLVNGMFAALYYSVQRLCGVRIWSAALAWLHFVAWQVVVGMAVYTLPRGLMQGRDHAELVQPIYLAMIFIWTVLFGLNYWMTLRRRRIQRLNVSLWFYSATIVTFPVLMAASNVVLPVSWVKSYPLLGGVQDIVLQWCYGQVSVYYLLLMPFLGLMYFFVPMVSGKPISSHRLAIVHFWALVILLLWSGSRNLHHTAIPEWLSTAGMLAGLMLWMPLWGGLLNGWRTLRGGEANFSNSTVYRFLACSLVFYAISTFEASLLSIKSVSAWTQYSDWTIAHLHNGMMGWNGMLAFGAFYWLAPRLFQKKLWSDRAVSVHFWFALVGVLLSVLPIYVSGMKQSNMWNSLDELGYLAHPDFIDSLNASRGMWWARILGGSFYLLGLVVMAGNFLLTWLLSSEPSGLASEDAARLAMLQASNELQDSAEIPCLLESAPVLDAARSFERTSTLRWHQIWESSPGRFYAIPLLMILIVSIVQLVPVLLLQSSVPKIASVKPYTPLELMGREIYLQKGCYSCHTQVVRPLVAETMRYGDFSRAGEFVYDFPPFWGKRRIGPDLAREGGKQSSKWHWQHLDNPGLLVEGTLMPSYSDLLDSRIDFERIPSYVDSAKLLGVDYDGENEDLVQDAKEQAERIAAEIVSTGGSIQRGGVMTLESQAVALIAYLQRLGTDLNAPVESDTAQVAAAQ